MYSDKNIKKIKDNINKIQEEADIEFKKIIMNQI